MPRIPARIRNPGTETECLSTACLHNLRWPQSVHTSSTWYDTKAAFLFFLALFFVKISYKPRWQNQMVETSAIKACVQLGWFSSLWLDSTLFRGRLWLLSLFCFSYSIPAHRVTNDHSVYCTTLKSKPKACLPVSIVSPKWPAGSFNLAVTQKWWLPERPYTRTPNWAAPTFLTHRKGIR